MRSARWKTTRISCSIRMIVSLLVAMQAADELGDVVGFLIAHARSRFIEQQQPGLNASAIMISVAR